MSKMIRELQSSDFSKSFKQAEVHQVLERGETEEKLEIRNESDLAKLFMEYIGDKFKYVSDESKWLFWNGRYWEEDKTNRLFEELLEFMNKLLEVEEIQKNQKKKAAVEKLGNERTSRNVINILKKMAGSHKILSEQLDSKEKSLNMRNCTIDLETCEILKQNKEDLFTGCLEIEYHEEAKCERFTRFLEEIFSNDEMIKFIQKLFGYCLTEEVNQRKFYLLIGRGSNGKSLLLNVLMKLLGDYSWTFDSEALLCSKGGNSTETQRVIGNLKGKRAGIANELPMKRKFNDVLIKKLTGEEIISGELKFKNTFQFQNTCKILISTNEAPSVDADNKAFLNRLIVIPFEVEIPEDKQDRRLLEKLNNELQGILNWALEGLRMYREEEFKVLPKKVIDASKRYHEGFDSLKDFIDETCIKNPGAKIKGTEFLNRYRGWLTENGYPAKTMTTKELYVKLGNKGYDCKDSTGNAKHVFGLEFKAQD